MDLKEEEILGDRIGDHWYYASKAAAMLRTLRAFDTIDSSLAPGPMEGSGVAIDVGSGSAYFARQLLTNSGFGRVDCVDVSYRHDGEEHVAPGKSIRRLRHLADAVDEADLALMMDVLEHVEDDAALVAATAEHLRPGGRVLVTVPAFAWLWSGHDEFLGHRRRYTLAQLEARLSEAGLVVERGHYYFGLVLPVAAVQRAGDRLRAQRGSGGAPASKLAVHQPLTNRVLGALCRAELGFQRRNRLAGLTVFGVGRRP